MRHISREEEYSNSQKALAAGMVPLCPKRHNQHVDELHMTGCQRTSSGLYWFYCRHHTPDIWVNVPPQVMGYQSV